MFGYVFTKHKWNNKKATSSKNREQTNAKCYLKTTTKFTIKML